MNTNSNIGKKVRIISSFKGEQYVGQTGTVIDDDYNTLVKVRMPDGNIINPYIKGNGKDCCNSKPQAEWVTDEKPSTFYITSDYPEIMKVFWEEMKKVGYTTVSPEDSRKWKVLSSNQKAPNTLDQYRDTYISWGKCGDHADKREMQFQIPQQWTEALQYITDAAKYWEEVEKEEKEYSVGEYIYIIDPECRCTTVYDTKCTIEKGDVVQIIKKEPQISYACATYKTTGGWISGNPKDHRRATEAEIKEATKYKVGQWVVITNIGSEISAEIDGKERDGASVGDTVKITGITDRGGEASKEDLRYYGNNWNLRGKDIRPATPEEIEKAQVQIVCIGDSKLRVKISAGKIEADGKRPDITDIQAILDKVGHLPWKVEVQTVKIGCCDGVTRAELQQIVEIYNRLTN